MHAMQQDQSQMTPGQQLYIDGWKFTYVEPHKNGKHLVFTCKTSKNTYLIALVDATTGKYYRKQVKSFSPVLRGQIDAFAKSAPTLLASGQLFKVN